MTDSAVNPCTCGHAPERHGALHSGPCSAVLSHGWCHCTAYRLAGPAWTDLQPMRVPTLAEVLVLLSFAGVDTWTAVLLSPVGASE